MKGPPRSRLRRFAVPGGGAASASGRPFGAHVGLWSLALLIVTGVASGQTIYKCKGADGRVTYSNHACAFDPAPLPPVKDVQPVKQEPAPARGMLPKQCDNGAALKAVVTRLDSPTTPDDVREFLADERFRLVRCEIARLTPEERRQRDAGIAELDSRDAVRRRAAMARVAALYEPH